MEFIKRRGSEPGCGYPFRDGFGGHSLADSAARLSRRPKAIVVGFGGNSTGGSAYECAVAECLAGSFDVYPYELRLGGRGILKHVTAPLEYLKLHGFLTRHSDCDLVIKTLTALLFESGRQRRSIGILHHADVIGGLVGRRVARRLLRNLQKLDTIVVVAEYWNRYLRARGLKNVYTIHNAISFDGFEFQREEIEAFKERHALVGKPIIYLGSNAPGKGVDEAFEVLKDLDVHLVASGYQMHPRARVRCTYFERREYLRLLKAATLVVTMSQFAEGWCRTAHEAMLCQTPVLGSGRGGMRELLEPGGQTICESFNALRAAVEDLLAHEAKREHLGRRGCDFARQFSYDKFQAAWLDLASRLSAA